MGDRFYLQQQRAKGGKMANYTEAEVSKMIEAYNMANNDVERKDTVEKLAGAMGRTVASVRAKLVAAGVYVKQTTKGGAKAQSPAKKVFADGIRTMLGTTHPLKSLDNMTKADLEILTDVIKGVAFRQELND